MVAEDRPGGTKAAARAALRPHPDAGPKTGTGTGPSTGPSTGQAPPPAGDPARWLESAGRDGGAPVLDARLAGSLNPLLTAGAPFLDMVARLRDRAGHEDPEALRDLALAALARFEGDAARAGLGADEVRVGRFALCATLDDTLRATPWGSRCAWIRDGLLSVVEPGAGGPQRFFDFLDRMLKDPRLHRRELELFYACLSLGFEGNFRLRARGAHDLSHLRDELYRVLRRMRGERTRALSPAWRGVRERFRPLGLGLPAWVVAAGVVLALGLLHAGLGADLDGRRLRQEARLAGLLPNRPVEIARVALPPPPSAGPALVGRIAAALGPELRSRAVEVLAGEDGALVIRILGPGIFAAGDDGLKARYRAVLDRVGQALAPEPGHVLVIGLAESPAPDAPSPSPEQAQSQARTRAEMVRALLERHLGADRLSAEGRSDGPAGRDAAQRDEGQRDEGQRVDVRLYPQ